jgi:hypothetical protein
MDDDILKNRILEMLKQEVYSSEEKANVIPLALAYRCLTDKERKFFLSAIEIVEMHCE